MLNNSLPCFHPHCRSSPVSGPYAWLLRAEQPSASPHHAARQQQQCLEVNLYLLLMVGCALPLLYAWQNRGRRQWRHEGTEAAVVLPWRQVHPLPCLVLASCLAWGASSTAMMALNKGAG